MVKKVVMYLPGGGLNDLHSLSPWIQLPLSFQKLGYETTLITGKCDICGNFPFEYKQTFETNRKLRSLFEPFLSFRYQIRIKPDIVIVATVGKQLFSILPLILITHITDRIMRRRLTKFLLKPDWSLDFSNISAPYRVLLDSILILSSYTFDKISFETHCGFERAKVLPLINRSNLSVVPLGYPASILDDRSDFKKLRKKKILCVARISPYKGQEMLLKAFSSLHRAYPDWKLEFVGPIKDQKYADKLQKIVIERNLNDYTSFYGFVNDDQLKIKYSEASIFCLPSIYFESAGQVKQEAVAMGLPVITTDVPCRIDAEMAGYLVSRAGDVDDLTDKLDLLMSSEDLRNNYVIRAKEALRSYDEIAKSYLNEL